MTKQERINFIVNRKNIVFENDVKTAVKSRYDVVLEQDKLAEDRKAERYRREFQDNTSVLELIYDDVVDFFNGLLNKGR